MANYETAFYHFELADNNPMNNGARGSLDQLKRANRRWKAVLGRTSAAAGCATDDALRDYIDRRKQSLPNEIG